MNFFFFFFGFIYACILTLKRIKEISKHFVRFKIQNMKIQNYANSIPQIAIYQTYKIKKEKKENRTIYGFKKREREGDEHEEQLQCRNQWR